MATPDNPPTESEDFNHFDLLELSDPPSKAPELPTWAATAIVAIGAIVPIPPEAALAALEALIAPLRGRPEGAGKEACRTAMRAKEAEIKAARATEAARAAHTAKLETAPVAPTERQAIPVVRDERPALVSPVVRPGRWAPLMRAGSGFRLPTSGERRARVSPAEWGARIEHAPEAPLMVGDIVRLTRTNGTRSSLHVVTTIVVTDGLTTHATVRDATDADMAPRPVVTAPPFSPPHMVSHHCETCGDQVDDQPNQQCAEHPNAAIASVMTRNAPERADGNIEAREGAASTIEGALGEIAATGASLAATPTTAPIFTRPASPTFRVAPSETRSDVRALLGQREFVAGAVAAEGGMLQCSWDGSVRSQTTKGALDDALIAIDRLDDAPGVPSAEAYAGKAVDAIGSGRGMTTRRLLARQITDDGIKCQWQIGDSTGRTDVRAGDEFGRVALVVSLKADDTLAFDGDLTLASAVRAHYATSVAREMLRSDVLTAWLQRILKTRHAAVKRGRVWYVPSGQAEAVEALIAAIEPLWGDHECIRVTTASALAKSLSRGLGDEIGKVEKDFADATERARVAARTQAEKKARKVYNATDSYVTQEGDAAFARATVSSVVASGLLRDLGTVAARVQGYETVLGTEATAGCRERIATLRRCLESLTDDIAARGAMLELD